MQWCSISDEYINKNKVNSLLHQIWDVRRDHLEGAMTNLAGMPSSSVGYIRELLVWYSIQRPYKSVMIKIIGEKKQRDMINQITLRGAQKVWRLLQL